MHFKTEESLSFDKLVFIVNRGESESEMILPDREVNCNVLGQAKRVSTQAVVAALSEKRPCLEGGDGNLSRLVADCSGLSEYIQFCEQGCAKEERLRVYGGPGGDSSYDFAASDDHSNLNWLFNLRADSIINGTDADDQNDQTRCPVFQLKHGEDQGTKLRKEKIIQKPTSQSGLLKKTRCGGKPPFTYTELIEKALKDKGEQTVSGIYTWIADHFPYYNVNDDRWKNSVRHNLSINPQFRKGKKASQGAGHLWTLSDKGATRPENWQKNSQTGAYTFVDEVAMATASIQVKDKLSVDEELSSLSPLSTMEETLSSQDYILDDSDNNATDYELQQDEYMLPTTAADLDYPLHQAAEDILNGVKRRVEVQYVIPITSGLLSPESGSTESAGQELIDSDAFLCGLTEDNSLTGFPDYSYFGLLTNSSL